MDIQLTEGATIMDLPALLTAGLECCPSENCMLPYGPCMLRRIKILDMHLIFDSPLPRLRQGWTYSINPL
ncbi:MAG: hypothetical protein ACKPKO_19530, partial [Candidatus Fonsibacter sp.]